MKAAFRGPLFACGPTLFELRRTGRVICPTGCSVIRVSSPASKNFSLSQLVETGIGRMSLVPQRGVSRSLRTRGGMRWTRQRFARDVMAGRVSRERSQSALTTDACCGRRSRVVLTPRRRRQVRGGKVGPTGCRQAFNPQTTVTRKPDHRGEHEISR